LLLGDRVTGTEAGRLGMIARVVPSGEHETVALELAGRLTERPPLALSLAKQVLDHGHDATLEDAMTREVDHAILTSLSGENAAPQEAFTRG